MSATKRIPKENYFLKRFQSAFDAAKAEEDGTPRHTRLIKKAAYYKARYELETNSYVSCGLDRQDRYEDYRFLDKISDYKNVMGRAV